MICITNNDGPKAYALGKEKLEKKLKDLTDLTSRLFMAVYKERGWRYPFIDLELEFLELTGEAPSLHDEMLLCASAKRGLVKGLEREMAKSTGYTALLFEKAIAALGK